MPLPRILRTASFRLAAIYLAIFSCSVVILGVVVYFSVRQALLRELDERVSGETAALVAEFRTGGFARVAAAVSRRSAGVASLNYRLENPAGEVVAGALPAAGDPAASSAWLEISVRDGDVGDDHGLEKLRVLVSRLPDGSRLTVGDDLDSVQGATHAILVAFAWTLLATLILGASGGLLLSAAFIKRIDDMTRTARAIIAGDLRQRVPETPANDDLGRLARTFNQMLDRIGALIEANRQVSNDIAHDLRSPLAKMLRGLERTRGTTMQAADYQAAIEGAIAEIGGILTTFNALLRIGQIETKARRAGFKPLDLAGIARDVAEAFAPAADDEGKVLKTRLSQELPMLGDRELLTQMIANLVDNALRHTPAGTEIAVDGFLDSSSFGIAVSDDGPGVPEEDRERIFDRFYRVDRARATPGSGLGLSLVAAVADLHDGTVSAGNGQRGLKVVIAFPRSAPGEPR